MISQYYDMMTSIVGSNFKYHKLIFFTHICALGTHIYIDTQTYTHTHINMIFAMLGPVIGVEDTLDYNSVLICVPREAEAEKRINIQEV
jgi:hypothetical protein